MRSISRFALVGIILILCIVVPALTQAQTAPLGTKFDANGWTIFTPSAGARAIYVSSNTGSDANSGLSPNSPLASIARALALLRNGSDDQLLLKTGDTWHESINWGNISGTSASRPILISSYGTGARPVIDSGSQEGFHNVGGTTNNIAFVGLEFYAGARDPNSSEFSIAAANSSYSGMNWTTKASNILIEDCKFSFYAVDIGMAEPNGVPSYSNIALRRNIIVDAYSPISHSQGIYMEGVNGLLLEGNLFDHNGWNTSVPGADPTIYNHNIYIQTSSGPTILRDNISANASSHGAQVRPGGIVTNNLFVHNPIELLIGGGPSNVSENVISEGNDISPTLPRGFGIYVDPSSGSIQIRNNIITHEASGFSYGHGITLAAGTLGDIATNNIIYKWDNPIVDTGTGNITSPNAINLTTYLDPNRTVETYNASLHNSPTLIAFLAAARDQSKGNWNRQYTAGAVNEYIRAGFYIR